VLGASRSVETILGGNALRAGDLEIFREQFLVLAGGRRLELTVRELALLTALAERAGRIVSREELYEAVWNGPLRKEDRSVDVYVARLRAKIERELPEWRFIHTHFGFGYRFSPERSRI
jgi:DNA-binding response OmpR family regulator